MKNFTNEWPVTENSSIYKLFAQIVQELTSESSWEGYRVDVLSSTGKIFELAQNCNRCISRGVPKQVILPVIEELNEDLPADLVLKAVLAKQGISINQFKFDKNESLETIRRKAALLLDLCREHYRLMAEEIILQICSEAPREKAELISVAKRYVSDVVFSGYSRVELNSKILEHFFEAQIKRCDRHLLRRFFENFRNKESEYEVYVFCDSRFFELVKNDPPGSIYENNVDLPSDVAAANSSLSATSALRGSSFSVRVSALDRSGALEYVRTLVDLYESLGRYDPGFRGAHVSRRIIYKKNKAEPATALLVPRFSSPSGTVRHRRRDPESRVLRLLMGEKRGGALSNERLYYSLSAAASSARALSNEMKITNIWSAFEALLPEPLRDGEKTVRISHFVSLILPCVVHEYPRATFEAAYRDLRREFGDPLRDFVREHGVGSRRAEQLASILMGKNDAQSDFCKLVSSSPLALQRSFLLSKVFADPKTAKEKLAGYERKVQWQLNRIYRQRNEIVHTGGVLVEADGLVHNAYSYYQNTIRLIERITRIRPVSNIEVAFELAALMKNEREDRLTELQNSRGDPATTVGIMRAHLFSDVPVI